MRPVPIQTGRQYGNLTILTETPIVLNQERYVTFRCNCGRRKDIKWKHVRDGVIISCGCVGVERRRRTTTKHGHSRRGFVSSSYTTWAGMVRRCTDPRSKDYPNYGGRGITVDDRWRYFPFFLEDMGEKPSDLTLERIDNECGYSKANCRWATYTEQNNNKRNNKTYGKN